MHFERLKAFQNALNYFFSRKNIIKKKYVCQPYLKLSDPHIFLFGLIRKKIKGGLCVSIDCYSAIFTFF